jgi:hypothetical protein
MKFKTLNEGGPVKEYQTVLKLSGKSRDLKTSVDLLLSKLCRYLQSDHRREPIVYMLMPMSLA